MSNAFLRKLARAGDPSGGLSPADRDCLLTVLDDVRTFQPCRDIISAGDNPDHVHVMIEGWACRSSMLADGSRQITAFLIPGDFCDAQVTLFRRMDHSIESLTHSKVAFVSREKMVELTSRPRIASALWWAGLIDEAVLRAWIVNLGRRDAFDRTGNLICELHARLRNVDMEGGGSFEVPLTQEELSDALGLTSVHVNRTLRRLREEELATFRQGWMTIPDIARLQQVVGFDPNYLHLPERA